MSSDKVREKDAGDVFAETVAMQLRKLSDYQMAIVQPKILQLISETMYNVPVNPPNASYPLSHSSSYQQHSQPASTHIPYSSSDPQLYQPTYHEL